MAPCPENEILLGVLSCQKESSHRQVIRETWGKEVPTGFDLKFFIGTSDWAPESDLAVLEFIGPPNSLASMHPAKAAKLTSPSPDAIPLDCPDSYLGTAWKGKAIQRYAVEHNYKGLFLAMCDTLVNPAVLKRACTGVAAAKVFRAAPAKAYSHTVPCPHGGYGYWLSRTALDAIYDEPVRHYSEDQSTAFALHHAGVEIFNSKFFYDNRLPGGQWIVGSVSRHLSTKAMDFQPHHIREAWVEAHRRPAQYPDWDCVCRKCGGVSFKLGMYGPQCSECGDRKPMCD